MENQKAEVGKSYRTALTPELRSIDEKARTIDFVSSTETADRYGDVIRVAGWKLDNYRKNPVFLWGHKSSEPPIGKCVDIRTENNPPALVQRIQFADAATYPFADTIFNLYKGGFMRAVSVGFMPTEQPTPLTDLEGRFSGYEFNGQELLELSAVPIPANADCLARAVQKGFAQKDLDEVFSEELARDLQTAKSDLAVAKLRAYSSICGDMIDALKAYRLYLRGKALSEAIGVIRAIAKYIGPSQAPEKTVQKTADEELLGEPEREITSLSELGDALDESLTFSPNGSRLWRDVK